MIQWGGSQNGVLQKFDDGLGEVNLFQHIEQIVNNLATPELDIKSALLVPGMGLTYASKMLRFFDPNVYGALDSRVRKALTERAPTAISKIYDSNITSMVDGYAMFIEYLASLKSELERAAIVRPACELPLGNGNTSWRAADIEMALFRWAESDEP